MSSKVLGFLGFRVQGSGFGISGLSGFGGFGGLGFRVEGFSGLGFRA